MAKRMSAAANMPVAPYIKPFYTCSMNYYVSTVEEQFELQRHFGAGVHHDLGVAIQDHRRKQQYSGQRPAVYQSLKPRLHTPYW